MDVIDWLLQGDPAIRWQVMADLSGAPPDDVAAQRALVASEGWGARLLSLADADGLWAGGACFPAGYEWDETGQPWTATMHTLQSLLILGLDPACPEARRVVALVAENCRWEHDGQRYFDGEVEPCINGGALANAAYFEQDGSHICETLLAGQLADGGWNCWDEDGTSRSSFHSTICALEGLWGWERAGGGSDAITAARRRGEEYVLDRRLFRRASTGETVDPRFLMPSFPTRWYYDVLRALDYFRLARPERDERCADAIDLLRAKMLPFGLWKLELTHQGPTLFEFDGEHEGFPSRWITLRALRVLRWWDGD